MSLNFPVTSAWEVQHSNWIKENIEEHGMPEKPVLDPSDPKRIESETLQALKEGKITIDEAKEKLKSVRKEMADKGDRKMPKRLPKPEIPEDLKEKIAQVKVLEKSLHSKSRCRLSNLERSDKRTNQGDRRSFQKKQQR